MAFAHVNSYTLGGNSTTASSGTITAASSGDLVYFFVHSNSTTSPSVDSDAGAAWNTALVYTPSTKSARIAVFWKVADGSEPTSYTATTGSAQWRTITRIFSAAATPVVDSAANGDYGGVLASILRCGAADGQTISDNALSIISGGRDTRLGTGEGGEAYTTADNSYTGAIGRVSDQVTGGAYRIYTTDGETVSYDVDIGTADASDGFTDNNYSIHISFVESGGGGGSIIPQAMYHYRNNSGSGL